MNTTSFGVVLRRYRLAAGLTQEELAERAHLSTRAISDLERGLKKEPRPSTVRLLTAALGLEDPATLVSAVRSDDNGPTESLAAVYDVPVALTSLVGREGDLAQALEGLTRHRLLTLVGPGGIGKTRLAVAVAEAARKQFPDGVYWVGLAGLADSDAVASTVAAALGVGGRADARALVGAVRGKRLLLVVDNCEHLINGCARTLELLLEGGDRLRILATSRGPIGVRGEVISRVGSLGTPDPDADLAVIESAPSVRLLVERARAGLPEFTVTPSSSAVLARVCELLGGNPLALELAAARLPVLSPRELLERLGDSLSILVGGATTAEQRQQSVRATLEWSLDLLNPRERELFDRLAAFASGWNLAAAEAICADADLPTCIVLDAMAGLVKKCLVDARPEPDGETRFTWHSVIRQFARERLGSAERVAALRRRHALYLLNQVETAQSATWGGPEWLAQVQRLNRDYDEIRGALHFFQEHDVGLAIRLGAALPRVWLYNGRANEGRDWLRELLQQMPKDVPASIRVQLLSAATSVSQALLDSPQVHAHGEQALILARAHGLKRSVGWLQFLLSAAELERFSHTQLAGLDARVAEGLQASRDIHEPLLEAVHLVLRAQVEIARHHVDLARRSVAEALEIAQRAHSRPEIARALGMAGAIEYRVGNLKVARELLERSAADWAAWGEPSNEALLLRTLAYVAVDQGDTPRAASAISRLRSLWRRLGQPAGVALCVLEPVAYAAATASRHTLALRIAGTMESLGTRPETLTLEAPYSRGPIAERLEASTYALGQEQAALARSSGIEASVDELYDAWLAAAVGV